MALNPGYYKKNDASSMTNKLSGRYLLSTRLPLRTLALTGRYYCNRLCIEEAAAELAGTDAQTASSSRGDALNTKSAYTG